MLPSTLDMVPSTLDMEPSTLDIKIDSIHYWNKWEHRQTNKKSESYPVVISYPLEIGEEGKRNRTDSKVVKSRKIIERRKIKEKKRFLKNIKSRNQHIKNLSNSQLTDEQITLLSRGLKFIPALSCSWDLPRRSQILSLLISNLTGRKTTCQRESEKLYKNYRVTRTLW